MDIISLITLFLICLVVLIIVIKMISNRLKGRDELDGLFIFKKNRKNIK